MPVSLSSAVASLPRAAAAYGVAIGIAALAATIPLLSRLDDSETSKWTTFLILAAGAAASPHLHRAHRHATRRSTPPGSS